MARLPGKLLQNDFVDSAPTGAINGVNTTYTIPSLPADSDLVEVFLDGLSLIPTTHYSISTTTLTMVDPPAAGQKLRVKYWKEN